MAELYALSIKQPWAALVVHGLKTIEVRSWRTALRGRLMIHAANVPDERPEAWARVPPEVHETACLRRGVVGAVDLTDVRPYRSLDTFVADQALHLNEAGWYRPPILYGFTFANAVVLPFQPCPGQTRFFRIRDPQVVLEPVAPQPARPIGLLVSVRNAAEVEAAISGGASLIDTKEPARGSLGRADDATIAAVIRAVAGRVPVSAALGEWAHPADQALPESLGGIRYLKWGLAGWRGMKAWKGVLGVMDRYLAQRDGGPRLVAVAYADWRAAQAPRPAEVCAFACERQTAALLLDTWAKDGRTLLDHITPEDIGEICHRCRTAGVRVALAGSLGAEQVQALLPMSPDWFAVRGAVCRKGRRDGAIDPERVRQLAELLAQAVSAPRED